MHAIGPYEFTDQDVERTLASAPVLFDLLPAASPSGPDGPAAPFRAAADAALDQQAQLGPEAAVDAVWAAWRAAMAALRDAGAYGPSAEGAVVGLFRSDGGVPKAPVDALEVGWAGAAGDRQADRANHGRPWQALCLWSAEVIDAFAAAGDPLAPGRAGENVTLRGLPWERVVPGTRLQLGSVLAEVSAYAVPCQKNARWFADGRFDRMHHRHGAVSRVYATVLQPGTIALGDAAVLEPVERA